MAEIERALLIKGGSVISLATGRAEQKDILIEHGTVSAVENKLEIKDSGKIIDASGMYITPGWVDAHAHVYESGSTIGVCADSMASSGVTWVADAGTSGACNFKDMKERVIRGSRINVKAYLHISKWGISKECGELRDFENIDKEACVDTCLKYKEDIIGLKVRIDPRVCSDEERAMKILRELGDKTGLPVVVHASRSSLSLDDVLSYLKKGDIYAHSYADKTPRILDRDGCIKQSAIDARKRGVIFDLSHGNGNFSFEVAEKALEQGFAVDMISTDLHVNSRSNVVDLASTMSKMMCLGLDLTNILQRVTLFPAKILGLKEKGLEIIPGRKADLTGFYIENGMFDLTDSDGEMRTAKQRFVNRFTVLGDMLL